MTEKKDYSKEAYRKANEARIDALVDALQERYYELTGQGKNDQHLWEELYNVVRFR